jgi:hypothetical protein
MGLDPATEYDVHATGAVAVRHANSAGLIAAKFSDVISSVIDVDAPAVV